MIRSSLLLLLFLFSSLLARADEGNNVALSCLQTSRFVLFTKAINTIEGNYQNYLTEQFDRGHYSSFEYTKLKSNKSSLLPKSLCTEDIVMSIKEFTKAIKKNCLQQANNEEVKIYTREIASDISNEQVKTTYDSLNKAIPAAIEELKDTTNSFNKCNKKDSYIRKISSVNMYAHPKSICYRIIDIINQAKTDKSNCR